MVNEGKLRVGIVGAGRRVHDMYAPVLKSNSNIDVVGFWNRDAAKGQKLTDAFGYTRYSELDKLSNACDALIIAVNSSVLTEVTMQCIGYRKPILAETPVWTKQVVEEATRSNVSLAIAEQTPYLPSEQIKMKMLAAHPLMFGVPHTVVNDNRTFEYHGFAQLRRYIGFDVPAIDICGMSHSSPLAPFKDGNGVEQRGHTENWDNGQVRFANGAMVVYNFSSLYNRCPYRKPRSLRIYTDRATISNDDNDFEVRVATEDANSREIKVDCHLNLAGKTRSIEAYEKNGKLLCNWHSSTLDLTDQQEALKVIVDNFADHVSSSGDMKLLYNAQQGWTDFNLLMAIRNCSQNKRYISR